MIIDRQKIKSAFDDYVSNFNNNDGRIKLKIIHTYNVSKVCIQLAEQLGLSNEDIDMAYAIGMLHDIGRFEQIKRYGTFNDAKSINHAKLGIEILFEEGIIRNFISDDSEDELIKSAILYHNMYEIPKGISNRINTFSKIIRDADKIDIFRVNATDPKIDVYGYSNDELLNSEVSEMVMEYFKEIKTIPRMKRLTPIDIMVCHIAFVFGIYFDESIKIILEQGYLKEIIKFKSDLDSTNKVFEEIRQIVNSYINSRL